MTKKEILAKIEEIEKMIKEEFEDHEEYCEKQGYPSRGSNYELMCENTLKFYEPDLEDLYNLLEDFD